MQLPEPRRTILHIDLNSFFATAEQQANPFLRGKSMGVGMRDYAGSAILAASYPAKWQGIGLSTRYNVAKSIDPDFELASMDPVKYYDLHNRFIAILQQFSPQIEIYSIDEAFLDITNLTKSRRDAWEISFEAKHQITRQMGAAITCSIGIAPNKLLAKIASDHDKPDGITEIKWEERFEYLDPLPIQDVWGIGRNISYKMNKAGIHTIRQIRELSDDALYAIIKGYYSRLRLLVDGYNFEPVTSNRERKPAQSMQHAHTLHNATSSKAELHSLAKKMSERLAIRLRRHSQRSSKGFISFAYANMGKYDWNFAHWFGSNFALGELTDSGEKIYRACAPIIDETELKQKIRRITVGLFDLSIPDQLILEKPSKESSLKSAIDEINDRFGSFKIRTADILHQYAKETELSSAKHNMRFHACLP
ncbi:DNA polymerase IV [Candidatus Dojkabacteria bacterium]|nr:DNA polymerase IV [Candidatus Dojkabacteria bacterium]